MNALLTVFYAAIAATGNALFAVGQKQSSGVGNGLLFVAMSALVAFALALGCAALLGPIEPGTVIRGQWRSLLLSGVGLFLTYLGFNLLYGRFGTSPYVAVRRLRGARDHHDDRRRGLPLFAGAGEPISHRRGTAGRCRDHRVLDRPVQDLSAPGPGAAGAAQAQWRRTGTTSAESCTSSPSP